MTKVSSDTWGLSSVYYWLSRIASGARTRATLDVVEGELGNTGVELQKEGEGLANATGGTEDGDLGGLDGAKKQCQQAG